MKAMKEELIQEKWFWEETITKMRVVAKEVLRESGEERGDVVVVKHRGAGSCD